MDNKKIIALATVGVAMMLALRYYWLKREQYTSKPRIILFHATWCGYCKRYLATGLFERVGSCLRKQVEFLAVNADQQPDLVSRYGIKGFPSIIAVSGSGSKIAGFVGDRDNPEHLKAFALKAAGY